MYDDTTPTLTPEEARRKRPRLAISLGDPNGIGPEVTLKALRDARLLKYVEPVLVGSAHVLKIHAKRLDARDVRFHIVREIPDEIPEGSLTVLDIAKGEKPWVHFGEIKEEAGRLAMQAVEVATDLCKAGQVDGMVTAPISKEAIALAGYTSPGHTEFIAGRCDTQAYTMMMVSGTFRVGLVTTHIPIAEIPQRVTSDAIREKLRILDESLRRDFGIGRPRIAVLGLNPHAGDGGVMGREEIEVIAPSIQAACDAGHLVFGPFAADGFFAMGGHRTYDAVLAMYHDQGLIPFKFAAFDTGVNFTAGLPLVRTSPDHGTAFDIAGQGKAAEASMRSALYAAIDIARRRMDAAQQQRKAS